MEHQLAIYRHYCRVIDEGLCQVDNVMQIGPRRPKVEVPVETGKPEQENVGRLEKHADMTASELAVMRASPKASDPTLEGLDSS